MGMAQVNFASFAGTFSGDVRNTSGSTLEYCKQPRLLLCGSPSSCKTPIDIPCRQSDATVVEQVPTGSGTVNDMREPYTGDGVYDLIYERSSCE